MSEKSKSNIDFWNYRIFRHFDEEGNSWVDIREAYYSNEDKENPHSYAGRAIPMVGHHLEDLRGSLELISKAFDREVLELEEFDKRKQS